MKTKVDWIALMQHHGSRTRMLDWTESALIALFFSIRDLKSCENPVVYVFLPWELSRIKYGRSVVYAQNNFEEEDEFDEIVEKYSTLSEKTPKHPIGIIPPHLDNRIKVQQGVFTIHGTRINGLEMAQYKNNEIFLFKILIDQSSIKTLKEELFTMGISEVSIFPEIEGILKDLNWEFLDI